MNSIKNTVLILFVFAFTSSYGQCGLTGDTIFITNPSQLNQIDTCSHIQGSLVFDSALLEDLTGLTSITSVEEHFIINSCATILSLEGLENLKHIGGDLKLSSNLALGNLDGFSGLEKISGSIELFTNISLTQINGLLGLDTLYSDFHCFENSILNDLSGLNNVQYSYASIVLGSGLDKIKTFDYWNKIKTIEGDLTLDLPNIASMEGLNKLENIGGNFLVKETQILASITGLKALKTVGGNLDISYQGSLVNIEGLEMLRWVGDTLKLTNNYALSNCCPLKHTVDSMLNLQGAVAMKNNGSGCISPATLKTNCSVSVEEDEKERLFFVFKDKKIIFDNDISVVDIYDAGGRAMEFHRPQNGGVVDCSQWPYGIYIIYYNTQKGIGIGKLLVY